MGSQANPLDPNSRTCIPTHVQLQTIPTMFSHYVHLLYMLLEQGADMPV